jgi:hypothetical protein
MNLGRYSSYLVAAAFATTVGAIAVHADYLAPEIKQQGDISYVTGGVGEESEKAIEAMKHDFNLHILNADTKGAYISATHLTITDNSGDEVLETNAGPIFYAMLPRGKYTVEATNEDETKTKSVTITSGRTAHVRFAWQPQP